MDNMGAPKAALGPTPFASWLQLLSIDGSVATTNGHCNYKSGNFVAREPRKALPQPQGVVTNIVCLNARLFPMRRLHVRASGAPEAKPSLRRKFPPAFRRTPPVTHRLARRRGTSTQRPSQPFSSCKRCCAKRGCVAPARGSRCSSTCIRIVRRTATPNFSTRSQSPVSTEQLSIVYWSTWQMSEFCGVPISVITFGVSNFVRALVKSSTRTNIPISSASTAVRSAACPRLT
jgi:hypothetical protein